MRKRIGTVLIIGVVAVLVTLVTLRFTGLSPKDRRAGLWLAGESVTTPIDDWAFSDTVQEVFVETRTWYMIPHSVTTSCANVNGQLYLASFNAAGSIKSWTTNVERDPRIRVKIGDRLYARKVIPVTDAAEQQAAFDAYVRKYASWKRISEQPVEQRPQISYYRTEPV